MALVITIVSTAESLRLHPTKESWNHRSVATENPVEQGVDITDHVQPKPLTYTAELKLIDSPGAENFNPTVLLSGENRLLAGAEAAFAKQFFSRCQGLDDGFPKILALQTGLGTLTSMILLDWPQERNVMTWLPTTLIFQQIRVVASQAVKIPRAVASLRAGAKSFSDLGTQSGVESSILYDATQATTGSVPGFMDVIARAASGIIP